MPSKVGCSHIVLQTTWFIINVVLLDLMLICVLIWNKLNIFIWEGVS